MSCPPSSFRINTAPVNFKCDCYVGYFDDNVTPTCGLCHYSCLTCLLAPVGSNSNCDTCPPPASFRDNTISTNGNCPCMAGYLDNGD